MEKRRGNQVGVTEAEDFVCVEDLQKSIFNSGMNPINLDYYGSEQCAKGYSFGPFVRTSFVLHMVRKGRGSLLKEGKAFHIREGQAFLIWPGEETVYQADVEEPWSYLWIGFHGYQAETMMQQVGFTREQPVVTCTNMERLNGIMEELLSSKELSYVNGMMRMSALYRLLAELTRGSLSGRNPLPGPGEGPDTAYVKMAVELLTNPNNAHVRVTDVAKHIGISRNYLTAIFKREMGVSPQEYLMNFRMEKAGNLLLVTQDPISVVAAEVGYADPLSFSKMFRARFGMSPSEYREKRPSVKSASEKGDYTSEYPL